LIENHTQAVMRVELGKSGVQVSPLGIGTWAWGDGLYWGYGSNYGEADLKQAFDETLADGIDFFDTAEVYGFGKSERFLKQFREASPQGRTAKIATKFFPLPWRLTKGQLLGALRGSLKRLGLQTVDLYQVHWSVPFPTVDMVMDGMAEAVHKNLTRAVGVSNYSTAEVLRAHARLATHGIPLASNQIQYNLLQRNPDFDGMVDVCAQLGVTIIAYSPLKFGVLTGKYSETKPLPGARGGQFGPAYLKAVEPLLALLREIASKNGKTVPQVALNWVMQRGAIPIPGAKNLKQAKENAGALGWTLSAADMEALTALSDKISRGGR
jgi:aryl-alcohol dehydrogenase-like predicted oxidoreductase